MVRKVLIALGFVLAANSAFALDFFGGPGPDITGNDTGGILPYRPDTAAVDYRQIAADYCARWGRLGKVTSIHRKYGDYVSFVCYDRPGFIE